MDYVLATELARVNRGEAMGYYFVKHELKRCGVALEFLDQTFVDDGESEVGALLEGIQVLMPSIERRAIKRRFARGQRRVAEEGYSWVGVSPYGYRYTPGGQKQHSWAKEPDEVPVLEKCARAGPRTAGMGPGLSPGDGTRAAA